MGLINKKKFILTIGDDGAVLAFIDGNKLIKRLFATSSTQIERREMDELMNKHKDTPVYILLDIMEQTYTKQTLPAISSLGIGKLVTKRLDRDFATTDLKGALLLGKTESGRKDWIYMFASCPQTENLSEWIKYIISLNNKFAGVYMLPVEVESLVKKLDKNLYTKEEEKADWKFIVIHNKTGGFRQVVLHKGKVIFTRLIRSGSENLPDILAGNIEQEISNTIEYLRRLSFEEDEKINIIILVSQDIKKSLETSKINCNHLSLITPFEASELLKFQNVASVEDKFGDLFFSANFANSKPILKLHNPETKNIQNLMTAQTLTMSMVASIIPIFFLYLAYNFYSIASIKSDIQRVQNEKITAQKKWTDARSTEEYDINEATKITDTITAHNILITLKKSPIEVLTILQAGMQQDAIVNSFNWKYNKDLQKEKSANIVTAIFNMDFSNTGENIEELFSNFDSFLRRMRTKFKDFHLESSKLPDKISFQEKNKLINIQVTVTSIDQDNNSNNNRRR